MTHRTLTVFSLAMINLAAVMSVRNWPTVAEYGFSSVFFFALAALIFFIPVSMVAAELATGWPKTGGVFVWVKEAFGHKTGFLAVWLLWLENVIYYPALISFIAGTVAYILAPTWAQSTLYTMSIVIGLFWLTTLANLMGMRMSSWISTFGVIGGTMIPGGIIILAGMIWLLMGNESAIQFGWEQFTPDMSSPSQWVFFSGVLVSLCGLEMSGVHARDVKNPKRNYPQAILVSALLIMGLYILGVLAVAIVVPREQIGLVTGAVQAFSYFAEVYEVSWMTPVIGALLAIGALGTLSTWIAGPSKGLLGAAQNGDLPPLFRRLNRHGMPAPLLIAQAGIVTVFSMVFLVMPTVSSAYWILNALIVQLYLIMYVLMFASVIRLRYKHPDVPRAYQIPGGKWGVWITGGLGIVGSVLAFLIGFFPPAQIPTGNVAFYVAFLGFGILLSCLAPALILCFRKPNWSKRLAHEQEE